MGIRSAKGISYEVLTLIQNYIMKNIQWSDFEKIDIRAGTIVEVDDFPEARKPAFKVKVDLGTALGIKKSSAQLTVHYTKENLMGKQVICIVNFPPKQIGKYISEILITGFSDKHNGVVLAQPHLQVPNGSKLF